MSEVDETGLSPRQRYYLNKDKPKRETAPQRKRREAEERLRHTELETEGWSCVKPGQRRKI